MSLFYSFPLDKNFAATGENNYNTRLDQPERYRLGIYFCALSPRTHTGKCKYAIDFLAEEGSYVRAVDDGVVTGVVETYKEFGNNPNLADKVNIVTISHGKNGNLFSQYVHILAGSCTEFNITKDYKVKKGQIIGKVGINGYMVYDKTKGGPIPHLHFMLFKTFDNGKFESIPIKFHCIEHYFQFFRIGFLYKLGKKILNRFKPS